MACVNTICGAEISAVHRCFDLTAEYLNVLIESHSELLRVSERWLHCLEQKIHQWLDNFVFNKISIEINGLQDLNFNK
jgi:DNA-binding transcriptional regulator YbjK